jgi:ATP-dependent Clp protease ATP-binding subunit ClpA
VPADGVHQRAVAHEPVVLHVAAQMEGLVVQIVDRREHHQDVTRIRRAAADWLATTGYDPVYGARPLKRLIQRDIENPLSLKILKGEFLDGDTIRVDAKDDELEFLKQELVSV